MKNAKIYTFHFQLCILTEEGFTLLELLAVLLLLGLSSLIVLPSIDKGLREREVRQDALQIAAVARHLRHRAISESSLQRLIFNLAENSYQASEGKQVVLSSNARITGIEGGEPLEEGLRQYLFFPNGSIFGGEIGISGREGSLAYLVRFDALTGKVWVTKGNS